MTARDVFLGIPVVLTGLVAGFIVPREGARRSNMRPACGARWPLAAHYLSDAAHSVTAPLRDIPGHFAISTGLGGLST